MSIVLMNTVTLDDGMVIRKGSVGGGGIVINNQSKSVEFTDNGTSEVRYDAGYTGLEKVSVKVAIPVESKSVTIVENGTSEVAADEGYLDKVSINVAIPNEEKVVDITENGTTEVVAANGFLSKVSVNVNVASSGGGSGWTGHADAEGLRAIGWTDEDIADFQQYGVYWDAEDDEYHKVSDDNKALYGVLTANNISTYASRIVYLPKIDTSGKRTMNSLFSGCKNMVAMPKIAMNDVTSAYDMFSMCHCLTYIPYIDVSSLQGAQNLFNSCYSLRVISILDVANITSFNQTFEECFSLKYVKIKNLSTSIVIKHAAAFSKASLLYMINNEANTDTKSIGLMYRAYDYLSKDVDVKSALNAHPNITLTRVV